MRVHWPTIVAIACLVYSLSIMLHELAHAVSMAFLGGTPVLISSTDVRGDVAGLDSVAITLIGVCGSLANWILAFLGWLLLRSGRCFSPSTRYFAWLLVAVNGFIPAMYLVVSPLFGFGDWMTMIRQYDYQWFWRVVAVITGLFLTFVWFRISGRLFNQAVSGLTEDGENPADKIGLISWLSGGGLAFAAGLFSPLDLQWALLIAAGSTLGTTWPMLMAVQARPTIQDAEPDRRGDIEASPGWIIASTLISLIFVLLFGPGIPLA